MRRSKPLLVAAIAAAFVLSACSSGLDQQPLIGNISFDGWGGPIIGGATLSLRVYEQASAGTKDSLVTEYTERGLNMDAQNLPLHAFSTNVPRLEVGDTYLIEVHVDVDLDGVPSPGDAVSVELVPFEAKELLDPVVIPVARVP